MGYIYRESRLNNTKLFIALMFKIKITTNSGVKIYDQQ
jgi:hypothetical protein